MPGKTDVEFGNPVGSSGDENTETDGEVDRSGDAVGSLADVPKAGTTATTMRAPNWHQTVVFFLGTPADGDAVIGAVQKKWMPILVVVCWFIVFTQVLTVIGIFRSSIYHDCASNDYCRAGVYLHSAFQRALMWLCLRSCDMASAFCRFNLTQVRGAPSERVMTVQATFVCFVVPQFLCQYKSTRILVEPSITGTIQTL